MDLSGIIAGLRREHEQLTEVIIALERMGTNTKRRGRPPAWMVAARQTVDAPKRRGRPPGRKNKPKETPDNAVR